MSRVKAAPAAIEESTPTAILQAADDAIVEADQRLAELEAAIEDGDDSVELKHIEAARSQSMWARARRKGAEAKAARAAAAAAEVEYDRVVGLVIPQATVDHSAREQELLEKARVVLSELIELNHARNVAIAWVRRYAADPTNFRRVEDGLVDYSNGSAFGSSEFEWRGDRYAFRRSSDIVTQLLRPLQFRIQETSAGAAPAWLALNDI